MYVKFYLIVTHLHLCKVHIGKWYGMIKTYDGHMYYSIDYGILLKSLKYSKKISNRFSPKVHFLSLVRIFGCSRGGPEIFFAKNS